MTRKPILPVLVGAATLAIMTVSPPAHADVIYALNGVQFSDGGTANGFFDLNTYGFVSNYDITTSSGSILNGATYASDTGQPAATINSAHDQVTFNLTGYDGFMVLSFASPLLPSSGSVDSLLTGSASFECNGFELNGACQAQDKERTVTAGGATVPEPVSLILLGAGLAGLGIVRRTRAAKKG